MEHPSDLAKSLDLQHVGGSDAHSALNTGDAYTLVEVESFWMEDVLEGIKKPSRALRGTLLLFLTMFRTGF